MFENLYKTELVIVPIADLIPNTDNPREVYGKDMEQLCLEIQKDSDFLRSRPPLANKDSITGKLYLYAGHQRVEAMRILGYAETYCAIGIDIPKEVQERRAYLDNMHHGRWDKDKLANLDELFLASFGKKAMYDFGMPNVKQQDALIEQAREAMTQNMKDQTQKQFKTTLKFDNGNQSHEFRRLRRFLEDLLPEHETEGARLEAFSLLIIENPQVFSRMLIVCELRKDDPQILTQIDNLTNI